MSLPSRLTTWLRGYAAERATVRQRKTGHPVRFELTEQTGQPIDDNIRFAKKKSAQYLVVGRRGQVKTGSIHGDPAIRSPRQRVDREHWAGPFEVGAD
jgi:hypothetical protein